MTGECCRGQTICKSCLDQWQQTRGAARCPVCNKDGGFIAYPNYHIEREIKGFHIYCTNMEKGCEWQGELNDINNHLENSDDCQFEEMKCSNECGKMIERRYLTGHECPRRKINCQYCHDTGEHQFIEGQHKEECPKLPLPCPNNCEVGSVLREDMEAHRKECPLEMIQCEYGCKQTLLFKDLQEHKKQNMEEHLMMTKSELTETNAQLSTAMKQINNLTLLINAQLSKNTINADVWPVHLDAIATMFKLGNQVCPVTIKMEEYYDRNTKKKWHSEAFYTHNKGYKMCLRIFAAGANEDTHLSVFLYLLKGPHDDELTWPLRGKFKIDLLNQVSDSEHHSCILSYDDYTSRTSACRVTINERSTKGWGRRQFIFNEDLHKTIPTCQYLKDDCLFFQVTRL